ncbi:tRNA wybutosine-synthesizing protein 2 homolog isoform X2 [Patella vulgata]|nr:tRNA wybutosine-synthesizing protein 2 homolog isoform X2 [Patella vulgata]XP_050408252.2 tRNA wybutosine-synthesizing protein 2 homolog isoform X2 [Patella vulgata]
MKVWDESRKLQKIDGGKVAIPVLSKDFDIENLSPVVEKAQLQIVDMILAKSKKAAIITPQDCLYNAIKELLVESDMFWTEKVLNDLPNYWEKHGDLILLPASSFQLSLWQGFGEKLWKIVAESLGCNRVAQKSVICNNGFRTPQVSLLLGQDGWVNQTDNKLRFTYDVTKCMFSIGNISEKLRISEFDCVGETVVDLYAGIGYFTIPYLVHAKAEHVHACEWNPDAVEALKKNLVLNNVQDKCTIYYGDNRKVDLVDIADRVNLGLIPSSEHGWLVACVALKQKTGGILHIHSNVTSNKSERNKMNGSKNSSDEISKEKCDKDTATEVPHKSCSYSNSQTRINSCDVSVNYGTNSCNETNQMTKTINYCSWSEWAECVSIKIRQLLINYHQCDWTCSIKHIENVKSYAPHVNHLVLDLECRPDTQI